MTTASTCTPSRPAPVLSRRPAGAARLGGARHGVADRRQLDARPRVLRPRCAAGPCGPRRATARRIGLERSKRVAYAVMPIRVASAPVLLRRVRDHRRPPRAARRRGAGAGDGGGRIRRHRAGAAGLLRPGPGGRADARRARPRADGLVPAAALLPAGRLRGGPGGDGVGARHARGRGRRRARSRSCSSPTPSSSPTGSSTPATSRTTPRRGFRPTAPSSSSKNLERGGRALPRARLPGVAPLPRGHVRRDAARDRAGRLGDRHRPDRPVLRHRAQRLRRRRSARASSRSTAGS